MSGEAAETPLDLWRRIRRLEITARRLVAEQFAGSYHSVFKGHGIEFAQIREYVPGDDVRLIDHNATARLGRPFVKLYAEERQLTVMLLVDMSASMRFGTVGRLKRHLAAEFAAAIAFAAISNNDSVGLVLCGERAERIIPPKKGRRHILRLLHELLCHEPATRGTRLDVGLETVGRLMRRRGTVFAVSDYLGGLSPEAARQLRLVARRHDLVAVNVRDRSEIAPDSLPRDGLWRLEDPESGRTRLIDLAHAPTRAAITERLAGLDRELDEQLRRAEVDRIDLLTDGALVEPLLAFFRRRARHLRQGV